MGFLPVAAIAPIATAAGGILAPLVSWLTGSDDAEDARKAQIKTAKLQLQAAQTQARAIQAAQQAAIQAEQIKAQSRQRLLIISALMGATALVTTAFIIKGLRKKRPARKGSTRRRVRRRR
jgi:hypothetical protein